MPWVERGKKKRGERMQKKRVPSLEKQKEKAE